MISGHIHNWLELGDVEYFLSKLGQRSGTLTVSDKDGDSRHSEDENWMIFLFFFYLSMFCPTIFLFICKIIK